MDLRLPNCGGHERLRVLPRLHGEREGVEGRRLVELPLGERLHEKERDARGRLSVVPPVGSLSASSNGHPRARRRLHRVATRPIFPAAEAVRGGPLWRTSKKASHLMRTTGTVKFFNSAKGFGFITPDEGGKDVFVHATAVEAAGMRALNEGDRVSFELEDDRRGGGKQAGQLKPA